MLGLVGFMLTVVVYFVVLLLEGPKTASGSVKDIKELMKKDDESNWFIIFFLLLRLFYTALLL